MSQPPEAAEPLAGPGSDASDSGRDLRLDLLRGACVLLMIFGHLGWRQFGVHLRVGFVGVAEAFFLLSGATLGVVAARAADSVRARALDLRLLWRAGWLFGANLAFVALYKALTGPFFPAREMARYWRDVPSLWTWLSFDQPSVLNVLPRYSLFLLLAPAVLAALRHGRHGTVLIASLGLWACNLATGGALRLPGFETARATYPSASWQVLFFAGLVVAHAARSRPGLLRLQGFVGLAAGLATLGFVLLAGTDAAASMAPAPWLERTLLGPLRLANLAVLAIAVWALVGLVGRTLEQAAGWLLLPFGRQALPAFVLHVPLVWALLFLPRVGSDDDLRKPVAIALILLLLPIVRQPATRRLLSP